MSHEVTHRTTSFNTKMGSILGLTFMLAVGAGFGFWLTTGGDSASKELRVESPVAHAAEGTDPHAEEGTDPHAEGTDPHAEEGTDSVTERPVALTLGAFLVVSLLVALGAKVLREIKNRRTKRDKNLMRAKAEAK